MRISPRVSAGAFSSTASPGQEVWGLPTLRPASGQSLADEWGCEDSVVPTATVLGMWLCLPCRLPLEWGRPLDRAPGRGCPWSQRLGAPWLEGRGSFLSI